MRLRHRGTAAPLLVTTLITGAMTAHAQTPPADGPTLHSPAEMQQALETTKDKTALANAIRRYFGADRLAKGQGYHENGTDVAFALELPNAPMGKDAPRVTADDGSLTIPLQRIGDSDIYAVTGHLKSGRAFRWSYQAGGQTIGGTHDLEVYTPPAEWTVAPGVPRGKVTQMPPFHSKVFDGTTRDWWVYVPAQAKPDVPCAVMVLQDGGGNRDRVAAIYDNLIAKGEIPPIVGIFINPGNFADGRSNRSVEYDTLSPKYAQFLIDEILPEVGKMQLLRPDGAGRGIGGVSSGGICAFTVAWERPDQFSKVESGVGSFTNLQGGDNGISGGHNYPALIRNEIGWDKKGKPRAIRVFQSDGANDLDNKAGNWPLANQTLDKALTFGGYDHRFLFGQGFHNDKYYMALMPDALRYLWSDEVKK